MFKSLATLLRRKPEEETPPANPVPDEQAPIYKELAMTDELRDALFPKTPQMVSAIFERSQPPLNRPPAAPAPPPASDGGPFPIIF